MAVHGVIRMQINDGKYKVAAHQNRLPNYVNININAGWRAKEAQLAHNQTYEGSSPSPATSRKTSALANWSINSECNRCKARVHHLHLFLKDADCQGVTG